MVHAPSVLETPAGPGPTPLVVRLGAAVPHLVAAGWLAIVFVSYVGGDLRLTPRVRGASGWLLYELLACLYASVLPAGMVLAGFVRVLRGRVSKAGRLDGSLLLLVPFAWLAWTWAPAGAARWSLLAFLVLALARWMAHRHEVGLLRAGVVGVAMGARRAVRVWAFFTAAFLLSAILVLPIEPLLGLEMPGVEHGQHLLLLGMGVVYFVLNGGFDLLDVAGRLRRTRAPEPEPTERPGLPPTPVVRARRRARALVENRAPRS